MVVKAKDSFNFLSYISKNKLETIVSNSLDTKKKLILKVIYHTGIDIKDLVLLKPKNISKQAIEIKDNNKKYFLPKEVYSEVLEYIVLERISPEEYLFSSSKQHLKPLTPKRIEQICKEIGEKNNLNLTPKFLKDSFHINSIKEKTNLDKINLRQISIKKNYDIKNLDEKSQLFIKLLEENIDFEKIKNIFIDENKTSNISLEKTAIETQSLFKKLVFEQKIKNKFLFGSKTKPVSKRRIEQILNCINITIKDIQRKVLLQKLIDRINIEISDSETKKFYQEMLGNKILIVRNSGYLEVYSW